MSSTHIQAGITKQCVYCGKPMPGHANQCPHCRETAPEVRLTPRTRTAPQSGGAQIRRGLLWMLLAAVIHYFAGGYSPMQVALPAMIPAAVTSYLTGLLFLSGAGLGIYGLYLRARA